MNLAIGQINTSHKRYRRWREAMQKDHHRWNIAEVSLSALVLFILLFFTYGIFARAPYAGFHYNPADGKILAVYVLDDHIPTLQEGDTILRVGNVSWQDFHTNNRQPFFENIQTGENIDIIIQRGDEQLTIPWKFPGFNRSEF